MFRNFASSGSWRHRAAPLDDELLNTTRHTETLDEKLLNMRRRMEALDEKLLNTPRHNARDDAASAAKMGCMEALDDELLNMQRRMEALVDELLNTTRHNARDDAASAAVRAIVLELGEAGATAVLPAFDAPGRPTTTSETTPRLGDEPWGAVVS
jgi:hypothetical protein